MPAHVLLAISWLLMANTVKITMSVRLLPINANMPAKISLVPSYVSALKVREPLFLISHILY